MTLYALPGRPGLGRHDDLVGCPGVRSKFAGDCCWRAVLLRGPDHDPPTARRSSAAGSRSWKAQRRGTSTGQLAPGQVPPVAASRRRDVTRRDQDHDPRRRAEGPWRDQAHFEGAPAARNRRTARPGTSPPSPSRRGMRPAEARITLALKPAGRTKGSWKAHQGSEIEGQLAVTDSRSSNLQDLSLRWSKGLRSTPGAHTTIPGATGCHTPTLSSGRPTRVVGRGPTPPAVAPPSRPRPLIPQSAVQTLPIVLPCPPFSGGTLLVSSAGLISVAL